MALTGWPSCGLRFKEGIDESEMLDRLERASNKSNGGFHVYTADTMPPSYHFNPSVNSRIAPIYVVPHIGWVISDRTEHLVTMHGSYSPKGNHGYDVSWRPLPLYERL